MIRYPIKAKKQKFKFSSSPHIGVLYPPPYQSGLRWLGHTMTHIWWLGKADRVALEVGLDLLITEIFDGPSLLAVASCCDFREGQRNRLRATPGPPSPCWPSPPSTFLSVIQSTSGHACNSITFCSCRGCTCLSKKREKKF